MLLLLALLLFVLTYIFLVQVAVMRCLVPGKLTHGGAAGLGFGAFGGVALHVLSGWKLSLAPLTIVWSALVA